MNLDQLKKVAANLQVPYETVVLDYALSAILSDFSRQPFKSQLVFKGGTSLRKCHFPGYRFSKDLDFSDPSGSAQKSLVAYLQSLEGKTVHEITLGKIHGEVQWGNHVRHFLDYTFAQGAPEDSQSIIIDYDSGEVCCGVKELVVSDDYGLGTAAVNCMALKEIYAEKVRAIVGGRTKARDVYDLWFLTTKGIAFDPGLVDRKIAEVYPSRAAFDYADFKKRVSLHEKSWLTDLSPLMSPDSIPKFSTAAEVVLKEARIRTRN